MPALFLPPEFAYQSIPDPELSYILGEKRNAKSKFKYWKFVCEQTDLVFCIWWHQCTSPCMDHTKSLKREHRLYNFVVPEFRYIRAARVVSRGRDFNTLQNRTFVPFVSVAQNVCCLSLLREMVRLSQLDRGRAIALILQGRSQRDFAQQFGCTSRRYRA